MRQIHPSSLQEKFVASGVYTHYRDDEPSGLVEHWTIHELPDQSQLVRVDWDGRDDEVHGDTMLLEALYSAGLPGEKLERIEVRAFGAVSPPYKDVNVDTVKATYTFFGDHLQMIRILDNQPSLIDELEWSSEWVVRAAGTHLLMGFAIAQYALQPDKKVATFFYEPHYKDNTAFEGYFCEEIVRILGEESVEIAGKIYPARKVEWLTPETLKPESLVWLDEHNILLRHKSLWVDGEAILTQYARRPELHKS
ncbi:MAG: hypothetical protein ABI690_20650 [Chloroflexota bacterium]